MSSINEVTPKTSPTPVELQAAIERFSTPDIPPSRRTLEAGKPNYFRRRAVALLAGTAIAAFAITEGPGIVSSVRDSLGADTAEMLREDSQRDSQVQEAFQSGQQMHDTAGVKVITTIETEERP